MLFTVKAADIRQPVDAPESIKQDPLFQMLVNDGSLSVPGNGKGIKSPENETEKKVERRARKKPETEPESAIDAAKDNDPAEMKEA